MPENKSAMRRYLVLDVMFRSGGHSIDELIDEVKERLGYGKLSKSTVLDDIAFMESSDGWNIELKKWQYGHKKLMAYADSKFSIMNMPLTQEQAKQLSNTVDTLNSIKGLPKFNWLEPVLGLLKEKFGLNGTPKGTVSLAQNENLVGIGWFSILFEAIVAENVVELRYLPFGKRSKTRTVCPYQLKQYNNRWYLVGSEEANKPRLKYVVVPLDRILDVTVKAEKFEAGPTVEQIKEHFTHIVGVSLLPEGEPVKVKLKVWKPDAWYIDTKKIHWSQKMVEEEKEWMMFELEVIPNEELTQQLLMYGNRCEVLEPLSLRQELYTRAQRIYELNKPYE